MDVKQIYVLANTITAEVLGEQDLVAEDLSNISDIGTRIENAQQLDNYAKALVNHIGKMVFVDRVYKGRAPSVLMDGWEFGSILEKVQMDLPSAEENEAWSLTDRETYDPNTFYKPSISAKFYNSKVTFQIPMSFTQMQVKQSFSNAAQLNSFNSMIYNSIDKSMTLKIDELVMRTINDMIAQTMYKDGYVPGAAATTGTRAINLLKEYNDNFGLTTALTADKCFTSPEFIRYAAYRMGVIKDHLNSASTLYNMGGKVRFTPDDLLHVIIHSEFAKAAGAYLQSDTYHDAYTALPKAETVAFWQGTGKDYKFANTGTIKVDQRNTTDSTGQAVTLYQAGEYKGIIGVMFDRDAVAVANLDRRVTSQFNPVGEFYNNWFKFDAGYMSDGDENFVVFYVA